ncbi:glycosyltransferase family 2 protein [Candidatus Bathyarchaeota archaeon]|nr:glycosyltransferase family 2 protein [Candidatus Bathyarchaeota archaeon]
MITLSIIIPTYNEEDKIGSCLNAILQQNYPLESIEIIIVDNMSTDRTVEIVENFRNALTNIDIIYNKSVKDAEISKMLGLRRAEGDLFLYLDADIEIVGSDWIGKLIAPLMEDDGITGSFPRFIPKKDDTPLGRYLRYHPLELDPVFQFFCTDIKDTVVEDRGNYLVCCFKPPHVPPVGICVYRRQDLTMTIGNWNKFMDIDVPVVLAKKGHNRFAYVSSCGIFHVNVRNLTDLIRKRLRNIEKVFLPNLETREFQYFDLKNRKDLLRIIAWTLWANLFIPKFVKGIWLTLRYKDAACMYEPIVTIGLTDAIIYTFLKTKKARQMLFKKR